MYNNLYSYGPLQQINAALEGYVIEQTSLFYYFITA